MSLTKVLAAHSAASAERTPREIREKMERAQAELKSAGIVEHSVNTGAKAPDFVLPNAVGDAVRLSELRAKGPVLLNFYRGGWCPYCNLELRALQEALPDIHELGASLVAISPETPDNSLSTREKNKLGFEVLSDSDNEVARAYGLVFALAEELRPIYQEMGIDLPSRNGTQSFELPIPATYVIDSDGTVRQAHVDPDYRTRMNPDDVVTALKAARSG